MKRFFALLLILALFCSAAHAESWTQKVTTPYYTLTVPEDWIIDQEDLEAEDGTEDLAYISAERDNDILFLQLSVFVDEDDPDLSLWNLSETELQAFIREEIESFDDLRDVVYKGSITVNQIPFLLFDYLDEDGWYIGGMTVASGHYLYILALSVTYDGKYISAPEENREMLRKVIESFQPVG